MVSKWDPSFIVLLDSSRSQVVIAVLLVTTVQLKRLLFLKSVQKATTARLELLSRSFVLQVTSVQAVRAKQLHVLLVSTAWDQVTRIKNVLLALIAHQHLRNRFSVHQVPMDPVIETISMLHLDVLSVDVDYSLRSMHLDNA